MQVTAKLSREKLVSNQSNPHLVLSLQAPAIEWEDKRPPLCIIGVIDLSGSMLGTKIKAVQTSLTKLVDHMLPGDVVGLVGFATTASILVAPDVVTPEHKVRLLNAINKMMPGGNTNLSDGMLKAIDLVDGLDLPLTFLKRAIIFTDGQPTSGVTNPTQILHLLKTRRNTLTFSAFGYGSGSTSVWSECDHTFLTNFSAEGGGNYAYVEDQENAVVAFGRELGGLCSTYAQNVLVEVNPQNSHAIGKVVTDVPYIEDATGLVTFKLPEMLSQETRHIVFETKLGDSKTGPRAVSLFNIKVTYESLDSSGNRTTQTVEAKARAQFVSAGEEQQSPDLTLDKIIALAQLVRTQLDAEEAASKGQFDRVGILFDALSKDLAARNQDGVAAAALNVRGRLSTQQAFNGNQGYLRSMHRGMTRSYGVQAMDSSAADQLVGLVDMGSNLVVEAYTTSFTTPEPKK